ncbi:hypothetical protein SDC9_209889 [bioreactor metagenome]|uniref:RCK C-terminal domain-containing protein n=1 Tax=bioreactor metagenome TaxID=1076179 RepID=A0A645JG11_9ZZZZ
MLSLSIISLIVYAVADLLKSKPIYESLLERLLKNNGIYEFNGDTKSKVILEIPVCLDSKMDCKAIMDFKFSKNFLLVAIKRGEKELIPRSNTVLKSGDYIHVLASEKDAVIVIEELLKICRKPAI